MASRNPDRLADYQRKRDFRRTNEPSGDPGDTGPGDRFVVQRHRARRRHYDLRLEWDGVLWSWAVPKGPTLDPDARRLAVHVEDHPLEYLDFEGVIPEGEYGGGDVIVWDRGRWSPVETDDPAAALEDGNLHFDLDGEKLVGRFVLIRPKHGEPDQWLLLHKHDDHAVSDWDAESYPLSVKSGRDNAQVAAEPDAMWHGDRPAAQAETVMRPATPEFTPVTPEELDALDALGDKGIWRVGDRKLALTNLNKELAPGVDGEPAVTKRDLIRYYTVIAPVMLPYLVDRPINTHRFPNGFDRPGFWQKQLPGHAPEWLRHWDYTGGDTDRRYLIADQVPALTWLANYGSLELHAWTSRLPDIDRPTWALFDIDPGEHTSFDEVLTLARLHRAALEHLGLQGLPKLTGQRGIQVWVPIAPRYGFARTREWVETVSKSIGATVPDLISWAWNVADRKGLARLDYTQNARHKTLVAPYSVRPRPGAPVSVPLTWDELDDPDLRPDRWTIRTVGERIADAGDPFAELLNHPQSLPKL